ncbi:MAG: FtsX-like permease family protein [Nitrococcus sp.]|nr:FtsX-like permease family protein [Nitrococcus sp.]
MKYLPLLWTGLLRKKTRTVLTLLSVVAAFTLFGMLDAVRVAFNAPNSVAGIDRLIVISRYSIIQPLPYAYAMRIQSIPGVQEVAYAIWFGGIYQNRENFFPNMAVSAKEYLAIHPEIVLPAAQEQAFRRTRTGAIVGRTLAERFGWEIGDKIPLKATIFPKKDGTNVWVFDLVGIFHADRPELQGIERQMLFHYDYVDEARLQDQGTVGWYIVQVGDPGESDRITAAIDGLFANSAYETKTQSEKEFQLSFVKQIGDIGLIVSAIMAAVFFTLVLLTGNAMMQAVRERIPELAVLKTIGFSNRLVLLLVLAEAIVIMLLGGIGGLMLARALLPVMATATSGRLNLPLTLDTWLLGVALMLLIGLVIGLPPALRALRLNVVDALRG